MKGVIMVGLALMVGETTAARADIPPPNDYVETCTVAKQQEGGKVCVACDALHGERDKCEKSVGTQGYAHVCKGWGASAWTEVWCKAGSATTKDDPPKTNPGTDKPTEQPMPKTADVPAPKKSNCAGGDPEGALGLVGALAALAWVRRR